MFVFHMDYAHVYNRRLTERNPLTAHFNRNTSTPARSLSNYPNQQQSCGSRAMHKHIVSCMLMCSTVYLYVTGVAINV